MLKWHPVCANEMHVILTLILTEKVNVTVTDQNEDKIRRIFHTNQNRVNWMLNSVEQLS